MGKHSDGHIDEVCRHLASMFRMSTVQYERLSINTDTIIDDLGEKCITIMSFTACVCVCIEWNTNAAAHYLPK